MQHRTLVAPVLEPFTLAEVKDALRVTHNFQDDMIWELARSARAACEEAARIAISPQQRIVNYRAPMRRGDEFGLSEDIQDPERILTRMVLPRPPLVSADSVTLLHRDGATRYPMLPVVHYFFDTNWGNITWSHEGRKLLVNPHFPTLEVVYSCGFPVIPDLSLGTNAPSPEPPTPDRTVRQVDVEDFIREAIFVTVANGYDDPDAAMSNIPKRALALLKPLWNSPRMMG